MAAQPREVSWLVLRQALFTCVTGIGTGAVAALALTRFLRSPLFGLTPTDPVTFVGVAILLALVALLACWIPARRATRVDPEVALRHEWRRPARALAGSDASEFSLAKEPSV